MNNKTKNRSILENHHCCCVFEMMRNPKFNILASLNDDQKKDVRDTVVELLLSTDMGNHARIFAQYRRRLSENPDWYSRKDDVRLAMVMAIKVCFIRVVPSLFLLVTLSHTLLTDGRH